MSQVDVGGGLHFQVGDSTYQTALASVIAANWQ